MFKKTSRTKNIRRKIDITDEEPIEEEVVIKKTLTSAEKKKKKETKKSVLSFGDEEEGDVEEFQVKKTKASRSVKLQLPDDLNPLETLKTEQSSASHYDAESLQKLRAETPSLPKSVKSTLQSDDALLHEKFPSTMNATIDGVGIPDAGAILAAKKKREQMRKGFNITEQDDGFISLNDTEEDKSGSRLMREEDDIGDDGEAEFEKYVGDKVTLDKKMAKTQEKKRRKGVRELIKKAEEDNGNQSEDMERWEEDMMKFGGAKTLPVHHDPYTPPVNYRPAQIPDDSKLPELSEVMNSLTIATQEVSDSMNDYKSNLEESLKTIENSSRIEADLINEINKSSQRYNYFQELAQYVNDLGELLDAKFPDLEKLELEVHDIIATKTEVATARRYQNNLDDLCLFADIPMSQLDEDMDEPEVDEFGRVRELRNSEAARQRRRTERRQRIEKQADFSDLTGEESIREQGLWTDDDMGEDYETQKDIKLETIQAEKLSDLMSDVGDEFKSLRTVKDKFEAWKLEYYDDYQKAYGSLSLPGAFEFYIRSELLSWDPFSNPMDFDTMQWHSILSEYGVSAEHEDPDIEMLNKVVEKSMIKKIKSMLDTLNAASSKEMRYAAQVIEQVSYYVDTHEKAYIDLAANVIEVIEKQITRFAEIISTCILKSDLQPEAIEAKHRFFWSQCKYLKTLLVWRRHLPKLQLDRLGELVMYKIITPMLKPESYPADLHLQNEAALLLSHLKK
ncbi:nineteen complex-related protein 2-domain-containing protein [Pilaira anomala]|nr:nineteen complex-related protein 2-domain-containing protein [Pilaira anomala]